MTDSLNIMLIIPEIFLALTAMGFLMVGVFQGNRSTDVLCWSSCLSFVIAGFILLRTDINPDVSILNNMLTLDRFAVGMKVLILIGLFLSLALSVQYLYQEQIARFEYPVLVIFAGVGMLFMVSATNMLSLYMALELQSLSLYVLAAFHRHSLRSAEAAAKYFILGALSSGMLLFGISLVYGFSGSMDFATIAQAVNSFDQIPPGFIVGMVFIIVAIAFKISAAPFHMWTPDVYQGAPTSVTAFFAIVPKIAALGLLIRLLFVPFCGAIDQWSQIVMILAVASLFFGAFAAIAQENIKRLFAYSSIGNMGYVLIGVLAGTLDGLAAVLTFLAIYIAMSAGIFAVILHMRRNGRAVDKIQDLAGLSQTNPYLAYMMAIFMFSMAGIPPVAGFFGKLYIFEAAISSGMFTLAVLGVLASVVAAYYYLRIIKVMFFEEPEDGPLDCGMAFLNKLIILLCTFFILVFTFVPSLVFEWSKIAVQSLF